MELNDTSIKLLKHWMVERERVRLSKESGDCAPWTKDQIIQNYRFCNVRREDDKNSKWLIDNIANNVSLSLEYKIANILAARMYNNLETMKKFFPMDLSNIPDNIDSLFPDSGYLCNAYMPVNHQYAAGYWARELGKSNGKTPSGHPALYRPSNLLHLGGQFLRDGTVNDIIHLCNNAEEMDVYKYLRNLPTMGEFMAYQHFVDLTYIKELGLSEDVFTICGPGAVMGLQLLFAEELSDTYRNPNNTPNLNFKTNWGNLDPNDLVVWMRDNFNDWFPEWPYDWTPTVMCLENCLCESHKYIKTAMGWGKPRNTFDGKETTPCLPFI